MKGLGADSPYWEALEKGELQLQQCSGCGKWNWPAVYRCGECGSWDTAWNPVPMRGSVYSWTRSWHDFGAPRELELPYVTVLVELEGGGQTRLLGVLNSDDNSVKIGTPVTGSVRSVTFMEQTLPVIEWSVEVGAKS